MQYILILVKRFIVYVGFFMDKIEVYCYWVYLIME